LISIEKDVPFPVRKIRLKKTRSDRGKRMKLPLAVMEIGDSILVCPEVMATNIVRSCVSKFSTSTGKKFICKAEGDSMRVWRFS
jgi:hypothetical protein